MKKKTGKVYIIGAGPGDPGLMTLRALQCLAEADVVIHDYLVSEDILARAKKGARMIYAGKHGGEHGISQHEINALLVKEAEAGNVVVRLKGGDPFIFSRGGEEAELLARAGLFFEIVPGVSSAIAAPAYAGIPLTYRGYASTVAFITGHEDPTKDKSDINWQALTGIGTLAFLMGVKHLPRIVAKLIENGKDPATLAALIRQGTTPDQQTLVSTLEHIARDAEKKQFTAPSVMVVGRVVGLREQINWFERKPLFGKGIVITRPREQAEEFTRLLSAEGARVISFPTIRIVPTEDWQGLDKAISAIESYQWIIFTSANGAKFFFQRLRELGRDIRDLRGIRMCAIGPATARVVAERDIRVDLLPERFIAEEVVRAFQAMDIKGRRILLPRAEVARDVIPEGLAALGAQVEAITVYRTVSSGMASTVLDERIAKGQVDVITFTSPSTVKYFMKIMGEGYLVPSSIRIACIGPVTAEAVRKAGMNVDIMQDRYTIPDMVAALQDYYAKRGH